MLPNDVEFTLARIGRERYVFIGGSSLGVILLPLVAWVIAVALLQAGSPLVLYWEPTGYTVANSFAHLSALYFTIRFARFLKCAWWLTVLYCLLSVYWLTLFVIPVVGLLVRAAMLRRRVCEEEVRCLERDLEVYMRSQPDFEGIVQWMCARGWVPVDGTLNDGHSSCDFEKPGIGEGLRVGWGSDTRSPRGPRVGDVHFPGHEIMVRAKAHADRGAILSDRGIFDEAIRELQAALDLMPELSVTRSNLGLALLRAGRFEEGLAEYREVAHVEPENANAWGMMGAALHDLGRLDEADQKLRRAITLDPQHVRAHFNLAVVLSKQTRYHEAAHHFEVVLQLDPTYPRAREYLANLGPLL